MKRDALEILDTPRFTVVEGRAKDAPEIEHALRDAGLLNAGAQLFPARAPMPFVAAPGSPWRIHHAYPGGLALHVLVNLKSALALARTYHEVYGIQLNEDWLRAATIWHDSAKTLTVAWSADGRANSDEGQIAGTARHHVLAVAEALFRGYPIDFVITLAAAHNPPTDGAGLDGLVKYLRAAALIAGKPFSAAGLSESGDQLLKDPPIEAFVHHLSDHDWVLTQVALSRAAAALDAKNAGDLPASQRALERFGEIRIYQELRQGGPAALDRLH